MAARKYRPGLRATVVAAFATVIAVLPVFLVGGLAIQLEEDLGMTATVLGAAVAVYWAASALLSTTGGYAAQRLGARTGMLLSTALGLTSLLGIAFATPHWAWLFLWLTIAGTANALSQPLSNDLIVREVSTANRAFAFGLKQAAIPAATFSAGVSVPILALTVGWKWAFAVAAAAAAVLLLTLTRTVSGRQRLGNAKAHSDLLAKTLLPRRLRLFLIATAIAAGMGAAQANALGAFTVISASNAGFDMATAGLLLGLGSAAGCLARPLVGIAADKGIGGSMATVALMLSVGCAGLLAMAWGNSTVFAIGCVLGFGFGWGWNGLVHYVVSHRAYPFTARATGIAQSGTYIGGTAGPLVFGFAFAVFGPAAAWTIAASVAAMGALAAVVAYRLEKSLSM